MQSFSSVIPKLLMSELKNPSIVLSTSLPRPGPGPGLEPAQGGVEVSVASVSVDDLAGLGLADVGDQADHLARLHRPVPPPLPPRLPQHMVHLVTNIIRQHCNGYYNINAFSQTMLQSIILSFYSILFIKT